MKKPNQSKTKDKKPKLVKPETDGSSPHPLRGKFVGEEFKFGWRKDKAPEKKAGTTFSDIAGSVYEMGETDGANQRSHSNIEMLMGMMWPGMSEEQIKQMKSIYDKGFEAGRKQHVTEDLSVIEEGPGLIRKIAAALGVSVAAWAAMPSAEDTPLGKALQQAAYQGDAEARYHLKKLDFYSDEDPKTLVDLHNKYLSRGHE